MTTESPTPASSAADKEASDAVSLAAETLKKLDSLPPPPSTSGSARSTLQAAWYVWANRQQLGPFTQSEIVARLRSGDLLPKHYVWRMGFGAHWYRLREVPEFRESVQNLAVATDDSGAPDRLVCPNCFLRIQPNWRECPSCRLMLKVESSDGLAVLREPGHRVVSLIGAALMTVSLPLPWLIASGGALATDSTVAGADGYLGESFALFAVALLFLRLQAILGGPARPWISWLIAAGALWHWITFASSLAAPGTIGWALGSGALMFAAGVVLCLGTLLVPSWHALRRRAVPGLATFGVCALLALAHLQFVNGNAYAPLLRLQLDLRGFAVEQLDRLETTPTHTTPWSTAHVPGWHSYHIRARRKSDQTLFVGQTRIALGSFSALRRIELAPVPASDEPLLR